MALDEREFLFSHDDFERIRRLIYERAGIALGSTKQDMVYSRLARRLRIRGLKTFAEYLAVLEQGDQVEWQAFVNALTTNLTSFFREAHHFSILAEHITRRKNSHPLRLWCAGVSTGEEAYSLAMTLVDLFGNFTPPVSILATDVDTQVLAVALAGVYPAQAVAKLPADKLRRFFLKAPGGGPTGNYVVRPELRALISFAPLNLLDPTWSVRGPFDAIFCRNVMIYFDKPTQYRVLKKFVPLLRPDGLLFAGHSENLTHAADLFKPCGRTVYALADSRAGAFPP